MKIYKRESNRALKLASNVTFLTEEERKMYASAIYLALMWGKKIDRQNKLIEQKSRI